MRSPCGGPYVVGLWLTPIHIGIPTTYSPAGWWLAMSGPTSFMASTARWARTAGSTAVAAGGGSASATASAVRRRPAGAGMYG